VGLIHIMNGSDVTLSNEEPIRVLRESDGPEVAIIDWRPRTRV